MTLTQDEGKQLAATIREWLRASQTSTEPGGELRVFIDDLENSRDLGNWAGADYTRLLPFRTATPPHLQIVVLIRNALVFLPIVLTWLALRSASSRFARYVGELRDAGSTNAANFLEYWESLSGWHRLSTVALIDAVLIFALILLTAYIGYQDVGNSRMKRLEHQHSDMIIKLERSLAGYRHLTIAEINEVVQGSIKSLRSASKNVEKAAKELQASGEGATSAVTAIQVTTSASFEPLLAKIDTTIDTLKAGADGHAKMTEFMDQQRQRMIDELDATRAGLAAVVQRVEAEATRILALVDHRLQDAANGIALVSQQAGTQLAGSLASADQHLSTSAQEIARTANDASTKLTSTTATEVATMGSTVRAASDQMVKSFEAAGLVLADATQRISDTLHRLQQMQEETATTAEDRMKATLASFELALMRIRDDLDAITINPPAT